MHILTYIINTFSTARVAKLADVSKDTLLRWLRQGDVAEPGRDRKGWRVFTQTEADAIVRYAKQSSSNSSLATESIKEKEPITKDVNDEAQSKRPSELIVRLIATGLQKLELNILRGQGYFSYPAELQRGANLLALHYLQAGTGSQSPKSIPELLDWCRRPLHEWPAPGLGQAISSADCLLTGDIPTDVCHEWAIAGRNAEAEFAENTLIYKAMDLCRNAGNSTTYAAFREFLIRHPVLRERDFVAALQRTEFRILKDVLRSCYDDAPIGLTNHGQLAICPTCDSLMLRTVKGTWTCEQRDCRERNAPVEHFIGAEDKPHWLVHGLRWYVFAPGRAELALYESLRKRGVNVSLYPEFDRYDLRVGFADDEVWAIDVKDWVNPYLLGKHIQQQARNMTSFAADATRSYFVFPNVRRQALPDYLRTLNSASGALPGNLRATFVTGFLGDVTKKLEELKHA